MNTKILRVSYKLLMFLEEIRIPTIKLWLLDFVGKVPFKFLLSFTWISSGLLRFTNLSFRALVFQLSTPKYSSRKPHVPFFSHTLNILSVSTLQLSVLPCLEKLPSHEPESHVVCPQNITEGNEIGKELFICVNF